MQCLTLKGELQLQKKQQQTPKTNKLTNKNKKKNCPKRFGAGACKTEQVKYYEVVGKLCTVSIQSLGNDLIMNMTSLLNLGKNIQ